MSMSRICIWAALVLVLATGGSAQLQTFSEWSTVDFQYDTTQKQNDLRSGKLRPTEVVILDSDLYTDGSGREYLFVTTPDLKPGTPFSLSSVTGVRGSGGYLLKPFPSPEWHKTGDCDNTITSVWRIKIDRLGRLWAVDSGMEGAFTDNPTRVCPPQLLVFDLNNLRLLRRYKFPENLLKCDNLLINLEVEILTNDTYAYVMDPNGFRLYVYSAAQDKAHFVDHPFFYPDPLYGFYDVNGRNLSFMDGIFSSSLGPVDSSGDRPLYFHALSSGREGVVSTRLLRDEQQSQDPQNVRLFGEQRPYHTSIEVIDSNANMIFADLESNSLRKWNTRTQFANRNFFVISQDNIRLQFTTGMKITPDNRDLLVTTSRLQNVVTGSVPQNQINYRVLIWRDVASQI